jgi:hypothetical protein
MVLPAALWTMEKTATKALRRTCIALVGRQ